MPTLEELSAIVDPVAAREAAKPLHFAQVAEVIDLLFRQMECRRADRATVFSRSPHYVMDTPWQQICADSMEDVSQAIAALESAEIFERAAELTRFMNARDETRNFDLGPVLFTALDSAAVTMLTFLRNVPRILGHHHAVFHARELPAISRASLILPTRLALTSTDRMMASQTALCDAVEHRGWNRIDQTLNASYFKVGRTKDGTLLIGYADFDSLAVRAGYLNPVTRQRTDALTRISEMPCHDAAIIGCPITLLRGRMHQLWSWYIEAVEEAGSWLEPDL